MSALSTLIFATLFACLGLALAYGGGSGFTGGFAQQTMMPMGKDMKGGGSWGYDSGMYNTGGYGYGYGMGYPMMGYGGGFGGGFGGGLGGGLGGGMGGGGIFGMLIFLFVFMIIIQVLFNNGNGNGINVVG